MEEALCVHRQNFNFLSYAGDFNTIHSMDGRQMLGKQDCNDLLDEQTVHFPNKIRNREGISCLQD